MLWLAEILLSYGHGDSPRLASTQGCDPAGAVARSSGVTRHIREDICFGSRADVAHQIVQQLRSGKYTTDGATSLAFPQIVLAGHSVGGLIAQAEAYTFGDIDGLVVLSYSDTDVSPAAKGCSAG